MDGGVGERAHVVEHLVPEREGALLEVGVQHLDRQVRARLDEVGEHPGHRGDADARAGEDERAGVVEHHVSERQGQRQDVAHLGRRAEERRHLAVRLTAAVDALDRELAVLAVVGAGQAVLARLVHAVRHRDLDRDVLARQGGPHEAVVDALDDEGRDVVRLGDLLRHLPLPPHRLRSHAARAVQASLLVDERVRHEPVDLVPRGGDLRRDGLAEHVDDRPEEVLVHHLVLLGADPERGVLVRDAREQVLGELLGRLDEGAREGRDRAGQRHLLRALRLVAAVERAVEQLRVRGEHVLVEALRDLRDVLRDHLQRRFDDGSRTVREHVELLR